MFEKEGIKRLVYNKSLDFNLTFARFSPQEINDADFSFTLEIPNI